MNTLIRTAEPSNQPRLDDPLDVMRRAFAQSYRSGLDPRVALSYERSSIEQHDVPGGSGLFYVVVRASDPSLPPQDVYRLYPDLRIVAIRRNFPSAIKAEIEQAEQLLRARRKKSA